MNPGDAIALNSKLDAVRPSAPAPGKALPAVAVTVTVMDLQGNERRIVTPPTART